jgi:hypothetical protein
MGRKAGFGLSMQRPGSRDAGAALIILLAFCLGLSPAARAQDPSIKDAVDAQHHHIGAPSEADIRRRLDRKLMNIARQFWLSAKADGLVFEDVVQNIGLRNAAMADFGLPLQVIRREVSDQFAVTARTGESVPRAWVSVAGASPEGAINLTAIDGTVVGGQALGADGAIVPACRYRVVLANDGEHDDRGHDDYAKDYPCAPFLSGSLDATVVADLKRWAADLVRKEAQ